MGMIKGQKEFLKFRKGEKLTRAQAMRAKCYECNGLEESRTDCEVDTCPMFPFRLFPKPEKALFMDTPAIERALGKAVAE